MTGEWALMALAGPANRQGRIAADVIAGRDSRCRGTQGTAVVALFGSAVAWTGVNEKMLQRLGDTDCEKVYLYPNSHAGYYPEGKPITMKVLAGRRRNGNGSSWATSRWAGSSTRAGSRAREAGDLVAGIVRRPDPVPCPNCAVGEWDMCRNRGYTERGIKEIDDFRSERWRIKLDCLTKVDPSLDTLGVLLEPATVVAKAWELIGAMLARAFWEPHSVLVTAAGPIGLLAGMIGLQHGLDVHVLDRVTEGAEPRLVEESGATYHTGSVAKGGSTLDVIIECTGVGPLIVDSLQAVGAGGVLCLTGVDSGGPASGTTPADLAREVVLENKVLAAR